MKEGLLVDRKRNKFYWLMDKDKRNMIKNSELYEIMAPVGSSESLAAELNAGAG